MQKSPILGAEVQPKETKRDPLTLDAGTVSLTDLGDLNDLLKRVIITEKVFGDDFANSLFATDPVELQEQKVATPGNSLFLPPRPYIRELARRLLLWGSGRKFPLTLPV